MTREFIEILILVVFASTLIAFECTATKISKIDGTETGIFSELGLPDDAYVMVKKFREGKCS